MSIDNLKCRGEASCSPAVKDLGMITRVAESPTLPKTRLFVATGNALSTEPHVPRRGARPNPHLTQGI